MPQELDITQKLKERLTNFEQKLEVSKEGTIISNRDGLIEIVGLPKVGWSEVLINDKDKRALAMTVTDELVQAIALDDAQEFPVGSTIKSTDKILDTIVGDQLLGRVIDPLGRAIDGLGDIDTRKHRPIERIAPGVIERQPVNEPLPTGVSAVDALIPIGKGQRELIIGDRQTGKTAIALDAIINQAKSKTGVISVYVAIGQKMNKIRRITEILRENGALENTVIVAASSGSPASWQFIAPFVGCAIAEEVMEKGGHSLIVYDDLTKQAWAYREISLLLKRPPSREAYPGDIFFLHSRLLERASKLSDERGGGSMTALPIIETQAGDISAYIPTNVISITDGQIYLEGDLFYAGVRPAVNVGLSVSRVGSKAQPPVMKQIASQLRLELAQARELAAFAQFASDLDDTTKQKIERGKRLTEILKQPDLEPLSVTEQASRILMVVRGHLETIELEDIAQTIQDFQDFIKLEKPPILKTLEKGTKLEDKDFEDFDKIAKKFLDTKIISNEEPTKKAKK